MVSKTNEQTLTSPLLIANVVTGKLDVREDAYHES